MKNVAALWQQYTQDGDRRAREKLILHYAPLVKYVVNRLMTNPPASIQKDDLMSYGILGLMEAIDRFDPNKGAQFKTYAMIRIRGQIIDSLREMGMFPRSVHRKARLIEETMAHLSQALGRTPTDLEIAAHLEIDMAQYHQWLLVANFAMISLDQATASEDGERVPLYDLLEDVSMPKPAQNLDERELKSELAMAIQALPEREQLLISLYYQDELTMKEIGQVLGVSESRVSQMHAQALLALRSWINRHTEPNVVSPKRKETSASIYSAAS